MPRKSASPPAPAPARRSRKATAPAPAKRARKRAAIPDRRPVAPGDPGIPERGRWPRIADPVVPAGIIEGLRAGLPLAPAAARVGIPERTVQRWHARGLASVVALYDADDAGLPLPEPDEPYHTFAIEIGKARGAAEAAAVAVIARAIGQDDVDAAKWYLERIAPQRWANPARVDLKVSGDPDAPITVVAQPADLFTVEDRLRDVLAALDEAEVPTARRLRRAIETSATVAE